MKDPAINYAWINQCPVCRQGRVIIAKENSSGRMFLLCEECDSEWKSPAEFLAKQPASRDKFSEATFLARDEVADHPWAAYLHS
jgi:hypothetical protein